MKKITIILIQILIFTNLGLQKNCYALAPQTVLLNSPDIFVANSLDDKNLVQENINKEVFSKKLKERLKSHVYTLAKKIGPRNINLPQYQENLRKTEQYIIKELLKYGYKDKEQIKLQEYDCSYGKVRNIIVELEGSEKKSEQILVTAHYDTCLNTPGADDNASAVAGVLEIARAMAKKQPRSTVKFVFFVNEEPPFFNTEEMGSWVYAKQAREQGDNIKAVINFDMIGYYKKKNFFQKMISYVPLLNWLCPDFIGVVGKFGSNKLLKKIKKSFKKTTSFPIKTLAAPAFVPYTNWSDHGSFWKHGYNNAVMVTDTALFRNSNYHGSTDTPNTLDYKSMAEVVRGFNSVVEDLSGLNDYSDELTKKRKQVFKEIRTKELVYYLLLITVIVTLFSSVGLLIPGILLSNLAMIISGASLFLIAVIFAVVVLFGYRIEDFLVFSRYYSKYFVSEQGVSSASLLQEQNSRIFSCQKIKGVYKRAHKDKKPKGVVLFCYGDGYSVEGIMQEGCINHFLNLGLDVVLFDYRGYSLKSPFYVMPSEKGLYLDAEIAYKTMGQLYEKQYGEKLDPKKIVLTGHSLGAGVANYLAYTKPAGAFISISGFTSIKDEVKYFLPNMFRKFSGLVNFFIKNKFNSVGRIKDIKVPTFILHGTHDEVVPYELGKRLHQVANKNIVELHSVSGGLHNNIEGLIVSKKAELVKFLRANHILDKNV